MTMSIDARTLRLVGAKLVSLDAGIEHPNWYVEKLAAIVQYLSGCWTHMHQSLELAQEAEVYAEVCYRCSFGVCH